MIIPTIEIYKAPTGRDLWFIKDLLEETPSWPVLPEISMIEWGAQFLTPGGTFFDIGAGFGQFSIVYGELGHTVGAFEEDPDLFRCLHAGMILNDTPGWCLSKTLNNEDPTETSTRVDRLGLYPTFIRIAVPNPLEVLQGAVSMISIAKPTLLIKGLSDHVPAYLRYTHNYSTTDVGGDYMLSLRVP